MNSKTLNEDLDLLRRAARKAGATALQYYGASPKTEQKKDGTEVSEADHAANDCLQNMLCGERPDYGWLSEETIDDLTRLTKKHVWIVDPIDGTRAFLQHKPEWTVSAALVTDGEAQIGVVFNPVKNEWFEARKGEGATLNGNRISASERSEIENACFVGSKRLLSSRRWSASWPQVNAFWANSIAYRLALVAAAKADATLTHTPKSEWDMAASALIVEEAGGKVSTFDGDRLIFNREQTRFPNIVASGAQLHPLLLERTRQFQSDTHNVGYHL